MKMDYRVLTEAERKYTFSQSQQLSMQTGLIGYLRADFGSTGKEFYSTWNDFRKDLKTDDFKKEFDLVINSYRFGDGEFLSGRSTMSKFCYEHPESSYEDDRNQYGVRVDTERYSYLMRLNPNRGEYNLYCYCYQKEWLNNHLKNAERGIRFIDPHYQEQFRIADGEKISIKLGDGKTMERTCRYIDDYHLEVGTNLYHICEFAELCERNGHTVEPAAKETAGPESYSMTRISEFKLGDENFAMLLFAVEEYMGEPLGSSALQRIAYFYDTLKLPIGNIVPSVPIFCRKST